MKFLFKTSSSGFYMGRRGDRAARTVPLFLTLDTGEL
jgi:hypothetical protein